MTTTTLTLADFLLARYDEEAVGPRAWLDARRAEVNRLAAARAPISLNLGAVAPTAWTVDPSHVLADLAAKRRIVEWHSAGIDPEHGCTPRFSGNPWWTDDEPCPTLLALAQPFADHPDFREEWRA